MNDAEKRAVLERLNTLTNKKLKKVVELGSNFDYKPLLTEQHQTEGILDNGTFSEFVTKERERLNGAMGELDTQITGLTDQRSALERELSAIDAYEATKNGKAVTIGRGRRQGGGRRGSKREGLLALIQQNPDGMKRAQILEKMGLKGDKSGEMSVSNALTALVKAKTVKRNNKGVYTAPAAAA